MEEDRMGGMIPLGDVSRRPSRVPIVTILIILVNCFVFVRELMGGETFVTMWSAIPAQIFSGHHWITILTAMFMHASWSHIIGNMIFLWAFAPEIEDAMGPGGILSSTLLAGWWPCSPRSEPTPIPQSLTSALAVRLPR
jgi:membrane associated rhomboid family serine protease